MVPLIMAGIALGSAVAKGVAKRRAAKKLKDQASDMQAKGEGMVKSAFDNLDQYKVSQSLYDNKAIAANVANDNSAAMAIKANAEMGAANMAGQIERSSVTSGQAAAGLVAAEQMRAAGVNQGVLAGAQQKLTGAQMGMSANAAINQAQDKAYQYNELMPFNFNSERGIQLENQGIQGKITADNMRTEAFGDMMNGLGSAAMTVGAAYGTGTGFDLMKGGGAAGGNLASMTPAAGTIGKKFKGGTVAKPAVSAFANQFGSQFGEARNIWG
jgi:hypothetical protein